MKKLLLIIITATLLIACKKTDNYQEYEKVKDIKIHLNVTGTPTQNYTVTYGWQDVDGHRHNRSITRMNTFDTIFNWHTDSEFSSAHITVRMYDNTWTLTGTADVWINGDFDRTITVKNNELNYRYGSNYR
jgi:hypothetical protein